tara:strand:+ start:82 stop:777 length:696 start_codon:yes stop_codon:yes gene_type:complete
MKDNTKIFLKAITNSLLPEFMDSDELKMSSISKETQEALQAFLDDQMGDVEVGTYRQYKYEHINAFFQTKSIFEEDIEGASKQLKTILGGFGVRRTEDGYNVIDTYDFFPRTKYVNTDGNVLTEDSKKVNVGYTDVALKLAHNLFTRVVSGPEALAKQGGVLYGPGRMLAGIRIPEQPDRKPFDPKESSSLAVNWNVPEGQSVRQSKLSNAVLSAMPLPKQSSTSTKNREN